MKLSVIRKNFLRLIFLLLLLGYAGSGFTQEAKVNKRKIEREQKKKQKKAEKEYQKAVKQHNKNQSPNTRQMMKKSKRESGKNTPLKPASGKKCK